MTAATLERPDAAVPGCYRCAVGLIFPDGRRICSVHATEADEQLVATYDERAPDIGLRPMREHVAWPGSYAWPYGPNFDVAARGRLLDWAGARGFRLSTSPHACLSWLTTGRRCHGGCWDACWADLRGQRNPKPPPATLLIDATPEQLKDFRRAGLRSKKVVVENPAFYEYLGRSRPELDPGTLDQIAWLDHVTAWVNADGEPAVVVAQPYTLSGNSIETLNRVDEDSRVRVDVSRTGGWYGHGTWNVEVSRVGAIPGRGGRRRNGRWSH